jgi:hypothetical protein
MSWGLKITGLSAVRRQLLELEQALGDADVILRTGTQDLYAQVSERIQQRGQRTDGQLIGGGVYSKGWANKRRLAGRQISYIDFTFDGDLVDRGFIVGPTPGGGWGLGWANSMSADRAKHLEAYFGTVFKPSAKEKEQAFGYILQAISNEIRRRNRKG